MFKMLSPISVILIALGLIYRRDTSKHIPLMLAAFVVDFILLIWIEFQDRAVEQVVAGVQTTSMDSFTLFHVSVSTLVLLFYALLIYTGTKVLKDRAATIKLHRILAYLFLVFKLANFITAFYMV